MEGVSIKYQIENIFCKKFQNIDALHTNTKIPQYFGPREKNDFGQLCAPNSQLEGTQFQQTGDSDNYLIMDYEMHLGTKIDYLFFQSSRLLQAIEIELLQKQMWTRTYPDPH